MEGDHPKKPPTHLKALPDELERVPLRGIVRISPRLCAAFWLLVRGSPQQIALAGDTNLPSPWP